MIHQFYIVYIVIRTPGPDCDRKREIRFSTQTRLLKPFGLKMHFKMGGFENRMQCNDLQFKIMLLNQNVEW